ncbi:MAG: phosphoglucosamine mutase [Betaproteobacteria bacterium]|nr:phosphoglucosamine mutase [Betaproteobacteria bacterium]
MTRRWFGTDGIRGPVGRLPMTPEFVLRLGQAAGKVLMASQAEIGSTRNGRKPVVLIGKDTRLSGYMLEAALEAGLSSMGVDVRLVGPLPTPGVAYLTRALFDLRGMKIVVDAAHGAAYHIAAPVLHELGAQVVRIGHEPDGTNINQACGATHPQTMRDKVLESGADLGMALDGDADRVIMCDSAGRIYGGDELLWIIVNHRARLQPVPGVVGTLMSNFALEQGFLKHGIAFERAKVGDRYVLERLQNRGWLLGGEGSGHLLALDLHSTGDGIISGLQVLAAVVDSGKQLAELCSDLSLMPQVLINVPKPEGFELQADQAFKAVCAAVDEELAGHGRSLVRPSGTEPVIRVMVEHPDYAKAQAYAEQIASSISPGGRLASAHQAG